MATVALITERSLPDRPDRLDDYLAASEARFEDIRAGCEKKIVWYADRRQQRELAIVYVHGFSASRMETWPLCDRLARHLKANLFYTRLTGHGQGGLAMAAATVRDWQTDALEALTIGGLIGRKVILIGASTGGTLATWLAVQPTAASLVHSLILLAPNFFPKNPVAALFLWPPALSLMERIFGEWRCFTVQHEEQSRYWTVRYPLKAIRTMMRLVHLSWRIDLKAAAMPVLMIVNPWDRVINVSLAVVRYRTFGSLNKKLILFRGNRDLGRHVLAGDILSPESTDSLLGTIQDYLQQIEPSIRSSTMSGKEHHEHQRYAS